MHTCCFCIAASWISDVLNAMEIVTEKTSSKELKKKKSNLFPLCLSPAFPVCMSARTDSIHFTPKWAGALWDVPVHCKTWQTAGMHSPTGADPKPAHVSEMLLATCSGFWTGPIFSGLQISDLR